MYRNDSPKKSKKLSIISSYPKTYYSFFWPPPKKWNSKLWNYKSGPNLLLEYQPHPPPPPPPPKAGHCFLRSMHQNIALCLLSSQSINQSASQPEQPRRLSFFVKAYTCYIKVVACPRAGGRGGGVALIFFFIRLVRPRIYRSPK